IRIEIDLRRRRLDVVDLGPLHIGAERHGKKIERRLVIIEVDQFAVDGGVIDEMRTKRKMRSRKRAIEQQRQQRVARRNLLEGLNECGDLAIGAAPGSSNENDVRDRDDRQQRHERDLNVAWQPRYRKKSEDDE